MTKSNPMLAFGDGPKWATCAECTHYTALRLICGMRHDASAARRKHLPDWPACAHFQGKKR